MKQLLIILIVLSSALLIADWEPIYNPAGEIINHGMHFPQLPDNCGTDIYNEQHWCDSANPQNCAAIADDWRAKYDGKLTDFHIWYSWDFDLPGTITSARVEIYADIPAGGNFNYSKPGELLWSRNFPVVPGMIKLETANGEQTFAYLNGHPDDETYILDPFNHVAIWQMNLVLPDSDPNLFFQFQDTIYWLSVSFDVIDQYVWWDDPYDDPDNGTQERFKRAGWKTADYFQYPNIGIDPLIDTTKEVWNDVAVYRYVGEWYPIKLDDSVTSFPHNTIYRDLAFVITGEGDELPVELSSFTGIFNSELCSSTLNWTTQTESQNVGWYVYRGESNDPSESIVLNPQMIQGAGNSAEPTYYQYDDVSDLEFDSNYWYWIESVGQDGSHELMGPIVVKTLSEEFNPDAPELADQYGLLQNYPNPFNPVTYFQFKLPEDCVGTLEVYDIRGRLVATVFTDQSLEKDSIDPIRWVAEDDNGIALNSGIYFYKLKTDDDVFTKKMIIIK